MILTSSFLKMAAFYEKINFGDAEEAKNHRLSSYNNEISQVSAINNWRIF